jgi:hypothetical protein
MRTIARCFICSVAVILLWSTSVSASVKLIRPRLSYPIIINTSGSYQLSQNITVTDPHKDAIRIVAPAKDVTINLNGFSIVGPASCLQGAACTNTGSGDGIHSEVDGATVTVSNGAIRGMGHNGIFVFDPSVLSVTRVENVDAIGNGSKGIDVHRGIVHHCSASLGNNGSGLIGSGVLLGNLSAGTTKNGIEPCRSGTECGCVQHFL